MAEQGSLARYIWRFEPRQEAGSEPEPQLLTESDASRALSKDLKKRGWKFVGPTTMYAFIQSMGLINDHAHGLHDAGANDQGPRGFQAAALMPIPNLRLPMRL